MAGPPRLKRSGNHKSKSTGILELLSRLGKQKLMMMMMLSAQINDVSGGLNSRVLCSQQFCQVEEEEIAPAPLSLLMKGEPDLLTWHGGAQCLQTPLTSAWPLYCCHHQSLSALFRPLNRSGCTRCTSHRRHRLRSLKNGPKIVFFP